MIRLHLQYVQRIRKADGRTYYYFRRGDQRVALPGIPGSEGFMAAYQAALAATPKPIGADRAPPGSMSALAVSWYQSHGFTRLTAQSQRTYRRLLEAFLAKHGGKPVARLEPRHLLDILQEKSATPAQANALLNVLRLLLQHGFERGWRRDNPARDVKRLRYGKKPYATWTEEDIAAFESRWPFGTRARLALALLLYTGQRRGDVVAMGPQHVRNGAVEVVQQKTGARLAIPIHPDLAEAIGQHAAGHLAFLVTEYGKPFTPTGFYNWFTSCARAAGLDKGLSPHGLRKAAARRLAEAGCSPHEIMSITGHRTLSEVQRYAQEAEQKRLAAGAVTYLGRPKRD